MRSETFSERRGPTGLSAGWEKWEPVIMDQLGPVGTAMIERLGIAEDQQHLDIAPPYVRHDHAGCGRGPARCPDRRPPRRPAHHDALRPGPQESRPPSQLHLRPPHAPPHLTGAPPLLPPPPAPAPHSPHPTLP